MEVLSSLYVFFRFDLTDVDAVQTLTDQDDDYTARKYWNKLSQRLREEGSEVVTNCHRLKLEAADGKKYETDCANTVDEEMEEHLQYN